MDLARLINDKEVSETRLKDHIRNLDANNQNMQQLMYETHARAEQLQLQRDAVIARSREVEEKLQNALAREDGLQKQAREHEDRLARYEDALNQLNGWPLVAASANNIPVVAAAASSSPFLPPPAALGSRLSPDPLGQYRRSGAFLGLPVAFYAVAVACHRLRPRFASRRRRVRNEHGRNDLVHAPPPRRAGGITDAASAEGAAVLVT